MYNTMCDVQTMYNINSCRTLKSAAVSSHLMFSQITTNPDVISCGQCFLISDRE